MAAWSIQVAEWLALLTSDHKVLGLNPTTGRVQITVWYIWTVHYHQSSENSVLSNYMFYIKQQMLQALNLLDCSQNRKILARYWYLSLTFTTLLAFSADDKLIFFLFFPENGIWPFQKCQIPFSGKNNKNISKCGLLKILSRVLSVKVRTQVELFVYFILICKPTVFKY